MINNNLLKVIKTPTPRGTEIVHPEPGLPIPTDMFKGILENLPAITELYKERREGRRIELNHQRAMEELERQHDRWDKVIETRSRERDRLHDSLQVEIERAEDISHKLAFYNQWIESMKQPIVISQEVNWSKGGDE